MQDPSLRPPRKRELLYEVSALRDVLSLFKHRNVTIKEHHTSSHNHVLMIPGFGVGNWSFMPLKRFLERHGYICHDWQLGRNVAGLNKQFSPSDIPSSWQFDQVKKTSGSIKNIELGVPYLCARVMEQAQSLRQQTEQPIHLLGWSLGGLIAREVARELPHDVASVITMGTPIWGGPKYTITASRFRRIGVDVDWIEALVDFRNQQPINQPITSIYSKRDGIVHWRSSIDTVSPKVTHHQVRASHLGMGLSLETWKLVLNALGSSLDKATT